MKDYKFFFQCFFSNQSVQFKMRKIFPPTCNLQKEGLFSSVTLEPSKPVAHEVATRLRSDDEE
jgi:hypothetical protein